jgi:hypothetical protein
MVRKKGGLGRGIGALIPNMTELARGDLSRRGID